MPITVDIADRLYDYTDEEKAAEAVADFQNLHGLSDSEVVAIWDNTASPLRVELQQAVYDAVDANGSEKRAREHVPSVIILIIET